MCASARRIPGNVAGAPTFSFASLLCVLWKTTKKNARKCLYISALLNALQWCFGVINLSLCITIFKHFSRFYCLHNFCLALIAKTPMRTHTHTHTPAVSPKGNTHKDIVIEKKIGFFSSVRQCWVMQTHFKMRSFSVFLLFQLFHLAFQFNATRSLQY